MAFCSKCGNTLSEGTRFCASCGADVSQKKNKDTKVNALSATGNLMTGFTQLAQRFSLSPKLFGACIGFVFVFVTYLFRYLNSWQLSFWGLLGYLLVPALFALLIFTQGKNPSNCFYYIAPFGLKALWAVYQLFTNISTISFRNGVLYSAHIALALFFALNAFGKFDSKKIMLIISGAVGLFGAVMSFRLGFLEVSRQLVYFASVFLLMLELKLPAPHAVAVSNANKVG